MLINKMKMKKYYILSFLIVLSMQYVNAQLYSVNVNTTAIPPVNPVISQYVSSGSVSSSFMYGAVGCLLYTSDAADE